MSNSPGTHWKTNDTSPRRKSSPDATFEALADQRRRELLSVVAGETRPISESDLATRLVAARENKPLLDVTDDEHQQIHTQLHHIHLPKLANVGLIRRDEDRQMVAASRHPLFERPEFDALLELDDEATDNVLLALADERRRTTLSVLRNAGSLDLSTVAERVAAEERAGDSDEVTDDYAESVLTDLAHAHAAMLDEARLAVYDADDQTLAYQGHPVLDDGRLQELLGGQSADGDDRRPDVWTLDEPARAAERGSQLVECADEEIVVAATTDRFDPAFLGQLRNATDRGVRVSVLATSRAARRCIRENVPVAAVRESKLEWFNALAPGQQLDRVVVADREAVVLTTRWGESDRVVGEVAITGEGADNPLVESACESLGVGLSDSSETSVS